MYSNTSWTSTTWYHISNIWNRIPSFRLILKPHPQKTMLCACVCACVCLPVQYSQQQWWRGEIARSENPACRLPGIAQLAAAPSSWQNSGSWPPGKSCPHPGSLWEEETKDTWENSNVGLESKGHLGWQKERGDGWWDTEWGEKRGVGFMK